MFHKPEPPTVGDKLHGTHPPFTDDTWSVVDLYMLGRKRIIRLCWNGSTLDVTFDKHFWHNWTVA